MITLLKMPALFLGMLAVFCCLGLFLSEKTGMRADIWVKLCCLALLHITSYLN